MGGADPAKKQFTLVKDGKICLKRWDETLQTYRSQLDGLLAILNSEKKFPVSSARKYR
jgi:hypothetical protein